VSVLLGVFVYRELTLKDMFKALTNAAKTSSVVMFLAAAAQVAGYIMTIARMPQLITALLDGLVDRPLLLNFTLMVVVLLVGTAMDVVPTILILTPIFLPLLKAAGIDPVYFGIIFTLVNVLGLLTPPMGVNLFVASRLSGVSVERLSISVLPYILAMTLVILLTVFCEPISTIIPTWLGFN